MKIGSRVLVYGCVLLAGCSRERAPEPAPVETAEASRLAEMGIEAQKHVGLKVAPATVIAMAEHLDVVGTVQPVNSRFAQVRPLARGRIEAVLVRVGDRVKSGEPLARFDNIEAGELAAQLASARAELQRLKVQAGVQAKQAERNRRLAEIGAVPQKDYEQSRAEQQGLEESIRVEGSAIAGIVAKLDRFGMHETAGGGPRAGVIASPFAGVVTKADVAPGAVVAPETELFQVVDLSTVWVQAEVYEKDLGRIRVGQSALVTVDAYPGQPFTGRVTYISDVLDPETRTAKVRCEVANRDGRLKLDMFANVQLPTTFSRQALAVPVDALQNVDGKTVVFVRNAPTRFEAREVKPGKVVSGMAEIPAGLEAGEPIVVEGAFHLKSVVVGKSLGEE